MGRAPMDMPLNFLKLHSLSYPGLHYLVVRLVLSCPNKNFCLIVERGGCIALYQQIEKTHPSVSIRCQVAELRYILQAPQLKILYEEMVTALLYLKISLAQAFV
ncbi:hypothetical protein JHK82_050369 [Glycine max]|nr:hypothetical protein JHK85_051006 [Glycine max]KAG5091591.1 hypothetical protein JHK82_050369 [Glycine max]